MDNAEGCMFKEKGQLKATFGFVNAQLYQITTSDGQNFDAFMILDISNNKPAGIEGRFCRPCH